MEVMKSIISSGNFNLLLIEERILLKQIAHSLYSYCCRLAFSILNSVDLYGTELMEITHSASVLYSAYSCKRASILQNTDLRLKASRSMGCPSSRSIFVTPLQLSDCMQYGVLIDPSHTSHNFPITLDKYPTMHHFVTGMCIPWAHFWYKMVHCGIWDWVIVGFV